jgi:uncharacterized protein involved in exopolysaccharide biosynthesis
VCDPSVVVATDSVSAGSIKKPEPEARPQTLRFRPATFVPIVVLALLGLLVGFAFGATRQSEPTATTRILVTADPRLPFDTTPTGNDDADRFVQAETLVLSGPDIAEAVRSRLALSAAPSIDAVQVGLTSVVEITATATSSERARQTAEAVLAAYQTQRRDAYLARVDRAASVLETQLTDIRGVLGASGTTGSDAATSALATEYARLLAARNELQLSSSLGEELMQVLQQPVVAEGGSSVGPVRAGLFGLLLGFVLGDLVVLGRHWMQR